MCGIAGAVSFHRPLPDPGFTRAACAHMAHRGPDESGYHDEPTASLGMCRLKVVGLHDGAQPTYNADRTVACVFNGEIYNYRALRRRLEQLGHRVDGDGDAAVIPALYDALGPDFVHELHGMFAIALYDQRTATLRLYTDRVGKKPLFWSRLADGTVVFASELATVIRHPGVAQVVDPVAVDQYLSYRVVPAPHTIYRDVRKITPATRSTLTAETTEQHRYWSLDFTPVVTDPVEAADHIESLLREAVVDRLEAEVPLGSMLSGGLDSSLVVAMATRELGRPIHTFSVGFQEAAFDESAQALAVARHCGTVHHTYRITSDDARDSVDRILLHMGEPYAFPSAIAAYSMYRLAREHVTVVLTGDGSDEMFGGYGRYKRLLATHRPGGDLADSYQAVLVDGVRHELQRRLVSPAFRDRLPTQFPHNYLRHRLADSADQPFVLNRLMQLDSGFWLPDAQLVKIDRMAMAHSVEPRSPMLDHRLIEYVGGVSPDLKLVGGDEKAVLKRVAERYLPHGTVHRAKQELAVPLEGWLSTALRPDITATLLSESSLERGYFDPDVLRELVLDFRAQDSYALWTLFMLERWHQLFVDRLPDRAVATAAA